MTEGGSKELSSSASEFNSLAEELTAQAERENKLSLMDRLKGLFSKSKKESYTESEYNEDSVSRLNYKTASGKPWYQEGIFGSCD